MRPSRHAVISRLDYGTEEMREAGQAHAAAVVGFETRKQERKAASKKAHSLAREHGVDIRGVDEDTAATHLERWAELKKAAEAEEAMKFLSNQE